MRKLILVAIFTFTLTLKVQVSFAEGSSSVPAAEPECQKALIIDPIPVKIREYKKPIAYALAFSLLLHYGFFQDWYFPKSKDIPVELTSSSGEGGAHSVDITVSGSKKGATPQPEQISKPVPPTVPVEPQKPNEIKEVAKKSEPKKEVLKEEPPKVEALKEEPSKAEVVKKIPVEQITADKSPEKIAPPPKEITEPEQLKEFTPPVETQKAEETKPIEEIKPVEETNLKEEVHPVEEVAIPEPTPVKEPEPVAKPQEKTAVQPEEMLEPQKQEVASDPVEEGADEEAIEAALSKVKVLMKMGINAHFYYPEEAIKNRWEGRVLLGFRINNSGRISEIQFLNSSGYDVLDAAAIDVLEKMAEEWVLEEEYRDALRGEDILYRFPIDYFINQKTSLNIYE